MHARTNTHPRMHTPQTDSTPTSGVSTPCRRQVHERGPSCGAAQRLRPHQCALPRQSWRLRPRRNTAGPIVVFRESPCKNSVLLRTLYSSNVTSCRLCACLTRWASQTLRGPSSQHLQSMLAQDPDSLAYSANSSAQRRRRRDVRRDDVRAGAATARERLRGLDRQTPERHPLRVGPEL